jgi:hypothetical protein
MTRRGEGGKDPPPIYFTGGEGCVIKNPSPFGRSFSRRKEGTMVTKREKEEQYFAEQELQKRKELRAKLDQEKKALKKDGATNPHWMKCPKCGGDLKEKTFEDVQIDQCQGCSGVWLDNGELELLIGGHKAKGFLGKFLSSVSPKS